MDVVVVNKVFEEDDKELVMDMVLVNKLVQEDNKVVKEVNKELVMDVMVEGVVDKEVTKVVEKVNKEMVMDVEVEGVVDKEVTKVVEESTIHSKSEKVCGVHFSVSKNLRKKCVSSDVKISRQKCVNHKNHKNLVSMWYLH